jgi:U4/U6.U5 tri-snRNP component SNU23
MEKTTEDIYKNASATGFRRKWDKREYENLGKERYEKRQLERKRKAEAPISLLKAREHTVDLAGHVGKTQLVASVRAAGFYCDICRYTVKDSLSYYDHLNSPRHLKQMGMGAQTEKATVDQVKQRFASLKKLKEKGVIDTSELDKTPTVESIEVSQKARAQISDDKLNTENKKQHENIDTASESVVEPEDFESEEMQKCMGFKGFSSSKAT